MSIHQTLGVDPPKPGVDPPNPCVDPPIAVGGCKLRRWLQLRVAGNACCLAKFLASKPMLVDKKLVFHDFNEFIVLRANGHQAVPNTTIQHLQQLLYYKILININ